MTQAGAKIQMVIRKWIFVICLSAPALFACGTASPTSAPTLPPSQNALPVAPAPIPATDQGPSPTATAVPIQLVPNFVHIVVIVLENKEFGTIVGSPLMPYFNQLARSYSLLTQYFAVAHPSLPNYLALIAGDTFGIDFDCNDCIRTDPSLPDLIEASGRTWKTYQEDMPSPCFAGITSANYALKHNPFMYFTPIRLDINRCNNSIVPFTQLSLDFAADSLPNYTFITPNLCNDAHDCDIATADRWLQNLMGQLQPKLDSTGQPYLIIITWDEGQGDHSCCGLPAKAGGRVATILVSPQAKNNYQDSTPYSHYSLLKTIAAAWHLTYLGHAADPQTSLITAPWK
jgi:phosphatidylinositol-3-phosphatase